MIEEIKRLQKKEIIIISGSILALILILLGIFLWAKSANGEEKLPEPVIQEEVPNPFIDVRLSARSAIVKEVATGKILYEKNPDEVLPLASLTKVMTAMTALNILAPEDLVVVSPEAVQYANDSALTAGSYFSLKDMLKVALVASSNTAARSIALSAGKKIATETETPIDAFVSKMNSTSKSIGMENSSFKNPTGLDEKNETEAGASGSARDVARLFENVLQNHQEILEATMENSVIVRSKDGYQHRVFNTNNIAGELPNMIGSKTGYTDIAGGNLAVVIDPGLNTPVVIVVLGSSKEGRFKDVERLSNATLDYFLLKK